MTTHSEQNKLLFEYIDLRIRRLQKSKATEELLKFPPKRRDLIRRQIRGRILELVSLKSVIAQHKEEERIVSMQKMNLPDIGKRGLRYIRKENREDKLAGDKLS